MNEIASTLSLWQWGLLTLGALAGGAVNALAGGGTLITFPLLTAVGVPPVAANVTNTVALCPGYLAGTFAQARDLRGQRRRLGWAIPLGVLGGIAGGMLLLGAGERLFRGMVPYLILFAVGLLAVQEPLRRRLAGRVTRLGFAGGHEARAALFLLPAALYCGYFGAGAGIMILAALGLALDDSITRLNALKQTISLVSNVAAGVFFAFSGETVWGVAALMAVGALVGGALGGRWAGRIRPSALRGIVIFVGIVIAGFFLFQDAGS
ncbi:MAG: sulfite exporter TauE/SafE family protein [Verrucomicrobiae bacterium]|nr:sulfite exporter TauE/SafE family protein [Verrucomicrobiae bacterium]